MKRIYQALEFDKVLNMLTEHALSDRVRDKIRKLEPFLSEAEVIRHLHETTEARSIIEHYGDPPLSSVDDLNKSLSLLGKGGMLTPEELVKVANFLTACRRLKNYLMKAQPHSSIVAQYGYSINELSTVEDEINRSIRGNKVDDRASPLLAGIRRKIAISGEQIKAKLNSLLRGNKNWFSESFIFTRNGHYTLPVKREYKNQVKGTVIDISQSGSTYFIEPSSVSKLQKEIALLEIEEENEVRRILYALTALVEEHLAYININIEAMESLDFIFAKAKLSIAMNATLPGITTERKIEIISGRHPLLNSENIVPLNFRIGGNTRGVVITGPNTGGKTVALKTIGLLSLMAQSGLHVPAAEACFTINNYVLCDIGDGQSITENLSTFSSHMTNIIEILELATDQSLVLLDELGSGTDPKEGMGLAVAILEELMSKNCLFVAVTHYPELKDFADVYPGLINARMAFDRQSLRPLYKLEMGQAGESCALYIARRLGLPLRMIERAAAAAYGKKAPGFTDTEMRSIKKINDTGRNKPVQKRIIKQEIKGTQRNPKAAVFNIGDSVIVYPQKNIGIVYRQANEKGEVGVQIKKEKHLINYKRLKLYIPADRLYPENYDFSIIFDTVHDRKARKIMSRKHDPNLVIEIKNENEK
ncbi:MAG: DNA mismatch repair protein MutS [Clostridiales bacterium]|jgi:DNA mismatch repair protein MutS2|nr:DNA mismatch repair protein MutS [Clostridiales bacterium]